MTINNYTAFIGGYLSESGDLFKRLCNYFCLCAYLFPVPSAVAPNYAPIALANGTTPAMAMGFCSRPVSMHELLTLRAFSFIIH